MRDRGELSTAFYGLLRSRGLSFPDGRPLYAYRFARREYEEVGSVLRQFGPSAVFVRHGAALIVAYIAEWFRRERSGGHWDWIRPLRSIGYDYGPHARIQYRDIENLVSSGLAAWERAQPRSSERLLGIVREAGFPVASVREDPRICSWLKNAVRCAEKGFSAEDAVAMEAWRVSDRLAQALFEPAADLCTRVVGLRTCLPPPAERGDPVSYLDSKRPHWRDELPFDVESEDIRTMVEEMVRLREDKAAALDIVRTLILCEEGWLPKASLNLSGRIDLRRLPSTVNDALRGGHRIRIFPRPPFCEDVVAVAAIETVEADDGPEYELRPFVAAFEAPLALAEEARFLVQSGNSTIGEFIPVGGDALVHPIIALQIEQVNDGCMPQSLKVVGTSPAQTTRPLLALAIREEHLHSVSFSEGFTDHGRCIGSNHRIVSFSGTATAVLDGTRWTWRTAAHREVEGRLIPVGSLVPNVREAVYCGVPQLWIENGSHLSKPPLESLHWRPRGRGVWRKVDRSEPWGDVDLSVIDNGEIRYAIGASIVPPNFLIDVDRRKRELRITGTQTRLIAAHNLQVRFEEETCVISLGAPTKTATVNLVLRWDAELQLTLVDPAFELRLIDQGDCLVRPRVTLSIEGLKGLRLIAAHPVSLCMELRANDVDPLSISRRISGEVPLLAIGDTIAQLLSRSENLDARVRLSALGASDHIADIRWYDDEIDPFADASLNVVSSDGTPRSEVKGFNLTRPAAGSVRVTAPARQEALRKELSEKLPHGPWLIFGRCGQGKIRPKILPSIADKTIDPTALERVIAIDKWDVRTRAFLQTYSKPDQLSSSDRRILMDTLLLSRAEQLPLSSVDALRLLARCPSLAVSLLASCESLTERAALLDIQRELPFLWCATSVSDWLEFFSVRLKQMAEKYSAVGIEGSVAVKSISIALDDIVSLRPELSGHAKFVYLLCIAAEMARQRESIDGTSLRLLKIRHADGIRREVDRLISRHDDRMLPPAKIFMPKNLLQRRAYFEPYDANFSEIIAAPLLIADHASGVATLDEGELRRARDAWLYDPEYFETVVPMGLDEVLRNSTGANKGRRA